VAEAYEVLRDPIKRRQYDHAREVRTRAGARRPRAWFGSTDGFGDDLWSDADWGGGGEGWRFRNPFDVFKEFFGERDPWADMTPRTRRQESAPRARSSSSFFRDPFFSSPFSSPFFDNRATGSLFDQRRSTAPALAPVRGVEIKIHGFTDDEDSSTEEEEEEEEREEVLIDGEVVLEGQGEDEDEEDEVEVVQEEEDVALREAIRLSLEQEEERKRREQTAAAETDEDLEEAIRRSLEDMQRDDWMEVVEEASRGRIQPQHAAGQQRLPALH
jgi:curved DNA-binding protein CbpA